jgi:hypothetical protein
MSRIRKPAAVALACALFAAGGVVAAAPATAATDTKAPVIVSAGLNNNQMILPAVGFGTLRVNARITDNGGVKQVAGAMFHNGEILQFEGQDWIFPVPRISGTAKDGTYSTLFGFDKAEAVGKWELRLLALDAVGNVSAPKVAGTYQAKYKTRTVKFNVGPEPAAIGQAIKVSGQLQHVTPTGWAAFGARDVKVQFKAAGTSVWVTKGTLRTDSDGKFSNATKFHANSKGAWRVQFTGGATNAASTSAVDYLAPVTS